MERNPIQTVANDVINNPPTSLQDLSTKQSVLKCHRLMSATHIAGKFMYHVIGSEESPYSVKVRSYFRFKGLEHQWLERSQASELYTQHAKLPLIPLVVTPDEVGMQDSTPIIEKMEAAVPDPTVYPDDPVARFMSDLLEEFGDEWGNKWMFHMRWWKEIDAVAVSRRFAERSGGDIEATASAIRERMVPRVWCVGGNKVTAPQIAQSLEDALGHLEPHLKSRTYLMGERPAMADFGLWGQIYNAGRDPTAGAMVDKNPNVRAWVERMLNPEVRGDFESWEVLAPTLVPLIKDQVANLFLPWTVANSVAIENGDDDFTLELKGNTWTQKPQKYHARSLGVIRQKYQAVASNAALNEILDATACRQYLA